MAEKNWQAGGGRIRIPARAALYLVATIGPAVVAWAQGSDLAPAGYSADPAAIWVTLIGGIIGCLLLAVIALWVHSYVRKETRRQLRREAFVRSALNNLSHGVVMTDAQRKIVYVNDRFLEIYGLTRSDITANMTGPELAALRPKPELQEMDIEQLYRQASSREGFVYEVPDGRSILIRYFLLPNGGSVATHEDCSEQRKLSQEVENTKKFLELVVDNVPVSLTVERASDGRYLLANRSAETILNRRREDVTGLTDADIFNPQEAKLIAARDEAAIKKRGQLTEEHPISIKGSLRLFLTRRVTVLNEAGEPQYLIKTHEDVTDRRQTESRMVHLAYHDGLTDLPNRASFLQALRQMIEACAGTDEEFAVLCVDLDALKEINDVFGHASGDKLLIEVARRIQDVARVGMVARLSGDEFGLIIDGKQPDAAKALAEKLAESLAEEFQIDGRSIRTGVTTGISIFPRNGSDAASLLANAGAALFRAKAKSRGSIRIFEPEMDQQIRDRRVLHQDLSIAIKNGELSLHYQPQVKLPGTAAEHEIVGFEALARWQHPVRGFVSPADFIPIAEESGLIVELGECILREACREAASWAKPLQIAVNLSPAQFMHGDLVGLVQSILHETGLAPDRLELEITEGVLIDDLDRGLALLRRLKALGVRISMDDFGSGYSSLSYLQAFPFDKIKVDRGFVFNLGRNRQSPAIVRAVIGLGHGLEMTIVAEGVETQEQLTFLVDEHCDVVQGYLLGRPLPIGQYAGAVGRKPLDIPELARENG